MFSFNNIIMIETHVSTAKNKNIKNITTVKKEFLYHCNIIVSIITCIYSSLLKLYL